MSNMSNFAVFELVWHPSFEVVVALPKTYPFRVVEIIRKPDGIVTHRFDSGMFTTKEDAIIRAKFLQSGRHLRETGE